MTIQIDKKGLMNLLRTENARIMDLLVTFNVPETIEDTNIDDYLLAPSKKSLKPQLSNEKGAADIDELEERLKTIKNKMRTRKGPSTEKQKKRREAKKLKKNKEFKKVLISAAKSLKNENQKKVNSDIDSKDDIKRVAEKPVFNEEGKMVFSKFDFAPHPGAKVKKSHKNPKEILREIKQTNKKINELKEQGDIEKASEIKNEIAWKKAFDRIEGKKVKDDPKLLVKAIKKKKVEKKKAKKNWEDRKKKVETDIEKRQKKRQENLDKRIKDKKNKKFKKLSKKGRVIPGF